MEPIEYTSFYFLALILLSLLASAVGALLGFGFAIILVAFFQFFMQPVDMVGVIIILSFAHTTMRVIETRRTDYWRRSLRLVVPGLMGVPLGVCILKYLDPVLMKRYLNLTLLICVLMIAYVRDRHGGSDLVVRKGGPVDVLAGFVGGVLGGSCALSGPPVILLGVLQRWKKMEAHALWARFFFFNTLFSLFMLSISGLYQRSVVLVALFLIPPAYVGFIIGTSVRNRIAEGTFFFAVLLLLILSAVSGFIMTLN